MPSQTTIDKYTFFLNKFKDIDFSNPSETMSILQNTKNNKKQNISTSTVKLVISAIMWKLKTQNGDPTLINEYKKLLASLKPITDMNEKNHSHIVGYIPDWNEILNIRDKQLELKKYKKHLALSLFTYIPPRRLTDYIKLKYVISKDYSSDKNFNYFIANTNEFIFNIYKTSQSFHQQIITVPPELSNIIKNYVLLNNINNDELLLNMHIYQQLYTMLFKLLGCSVDNIRHSFISHTYKNNIPDSSTLENNAKIMAHSLSTHLRYRKNI